MSVMDYFRVARRSAVAEAVRGPLAARTILIVALHLVAIAVMAVTEDGIVAKLAFVLTWGLLNCFWLAFLRRPALSAGLSLGLIVALILLSRLKHEVIWTTVSFVDVMIIDTDTIAFLLTIFPDLEKIILAAVLAAIPAALLLWRIDPFRLHRGIAALGTTACLAGLTGLSLAIPAESWHGYMPNSYVSKFSRSGVEAVTELVTHGLFESDSPGLDHLTLSQDAPCHPIGRPPHIILVHDESSFDIRVVPSIKVPDGYGAHFRSFDGKERQFLVESNGGASWFAEYNVLTGLSSRSFGRFAYFLTRVAAGRVERGLPLALRRCGYRTFSFYPSLGAFMNARGFQMSAGIQNFYDSTAMGTHEVEPDSFYYDAATRMIEKERAQGPMFVFVYLAANHFPWNGRWRPDLMPEWRDLGNKPEVDEYLRRQTMSVRDYAGFIARLKREFPTESFMIVRYGDHQPDFASYIIEPSLDDDGIAQRMLTYDPRHFTTYYAIDTLNYKPVNQSSAIDKLDAPYLPLVIQELAGLPLDASFGRQKKIFERCNGVFYSCDGGAEARHFNRLLIDAGLIKGL